MLPKNGDGREGESGRVGDKGTRGQGEGLLIVNSLLTTHYSQLLTVHCSLITVSVAH